MRRFKDAVRDVSDGFLNEARQSPKLLADMAKMEHYMAESYSGRLFIELLQNADDARSTRIISYYSHGNLYFGNDGKPFDEKDLVAISRSGASDKQRGESIGYRGIGFKAAASVSNEIIIYSADTMFTFSKEKCSKMLGIKIEDIPTIRIPIFLEQVDPDTQNDIDILKEDGYTTIFVFKNARIKDYLEEIAEVDEGCFIFLNNIRECNFEISDFKKNYVISHIEDDDSECVEVKSSETRT